MVLLAGAGGTGAAGLEASAAMWAGAVTTTLLRLTGRVLMHAMPRAAAGVPFSV